MSKQNGKSSRRKQLGKENSVPESYNDSLLQDILGERVDEVVGRRSAVGKRSLGLVDADDSIDVEINDDEKEKEERKRELDEKRKLENAEAAKAVRAEFKALEALTEAELNEHFHKCFDLVNRNKVNAKNAFKLQLIDHMKTLVKKQWEISENLTLVSCTLGASVKIYAHRVDKVHADITKFALSKDKDWPKGDLDNEDQEYDNENDNENVEESGIHTKRKNRSNSDDDKDLLPEIDMGQMLLEEEEILTSKGEAEMLDRELLPRGIEYFTEARATDSTSLLTLKYMLFSNENLHLQDNDIIIQGPYYTDDFPTFDLAGYIPNYKDIKKGFVIIGEENGPEESPELANSSLAYDPSINMDVPDSIRHEGDDPDLGFDGPAPDTWVPDYDEDYNSDGDNKSLSLKSGQVSYVQPRQFTVQDMRPYLSAKSCDYSYFDNDRIDFLIGPKHWRIKRSKPTEDQNHKPSEHNKKQQKKNFYLNFNAEAAAEAGKFYKDAVNSQLTRRTIMMWSASKLKNLIDVVFSPKTLLGLMNNEDISYTRKSHKNDHNTGVDLDVDVDIITLGDCDGVEPDQEDFNECESLESHAQAHSPETLVPCEESAVDMEVHDSMYELVPAPQRVNKIPIKFATEQKRINIKGVKTALWELFDFEEEASLKTVNFSEVYSQLPDKLPIEDAEALSFPIAFMSLLHMANEKTLEIKNTQDLSDISVSIG